MDINREKARARIWSRGGSKNRRERERRQTAETATLKRRDNFSNDRRGKPRGLGNRESYERERERERERKTENERNASKSDTGRNRRVNFSRGKERNSRGNGSGNGAARGGCRRAGGARKEETEDEFPKTTLECI